MKMPIGFKTIRRLLHILPPSQRGSVALLVALMLVVLLGFVALGTEVGVLLMTSRQMQSAADSAALAAAVAKNKGYPAAFADDAFAVARAAGFISGEADTTITVNNPPVSGAYAGDETAIEVVIQQLQHLVLVPMFYGGPWPLRVRAVATTGGGGGPCVLALETSANEPLYANNGGQLLIAGCGVGSNSSSNRAIRASGNGRITAASLTTVGNYYTSGGGTITISGSIDIHASATPDPYLDRVVPTPSTCRTVPPMPFNGELPQGTYCAGINITNGSHVTLNGLYILRTGDFVVQGGSTLSGTASIVLTGTGSGTNTGVVTITGGAVINLTALATGPTAGMIFFQDRRARTTGTNNFYGGTTSTLTGALYFPRQTVNFSNGGSTTAACTEIIARRILIGGGSTVNINCGGGGTPISGGTPRLVE